jgi:SpoVK/Ycf46/Vps4 family AAA+-type ATPase
MGRRLVARRVSDIQGIWVGESEQNIAAAFHEAETDDAVLLFDEADSFLRDRRYALRTWEVNPTNEFLQQLERFRGTVACTTNLRDDLDPACLRRFIFKIPFDPLRPEQARRLFADLVGGRRASAAHADDLDCLSSLTPGDFATVKRRLQVLGEVPDPERVLAELRFELEARRTPSRAAFR